MRRSDSAAGGRRRRPLAAASVPQHSRATTCGMLNMMAALRRCAAGVPRRLLLEVPSGCPSVRLGTASAAVRDASTKDACEHVLILGGGIAGLSTARYLLRSRNTRVTLIDRNDDVLPASSVSSLPSYEEQICSQMHKMIPSRRNGNVLCPSLTVPWTTRSLWKEAILPELKSAIGFRDDSSHHSPAITFDWSQLCRDRYMVCFLSSSDFVLVNRLPCNHHNLFSLLNVCVALH